MLLGLTYQLKPEEVVACSPVLFFTLLGISIAGWDAASDSPLRFGQRGLVVSSCQRPSDPSLEKFVESPQNDVGAQANIIGIQIVCTRLDQRAFYFLCELIDCQN